MRDFVFVEDVIAVAMHFLNKPVSGIYNCGTGRAQPFNDVALSVVNALSEKKRTLKEAVEEGLIEYIPFPEDLKGKYQAYTQANLEKLRAAGCDVHFKRKVRPNTCTTCRKPIRQAINNGATRGIPRSGRRD